MTKRSANGYPEARSDGLLTEAVGDELVIFDTETNEAHALKPLAAAVFAACDGSTPATELAAHVSAKLGRVVDVAEVDAAVVELEETGLLVDAEGVSGISRRRMLQVSGVAAAGVLVTSAVAPAFAAAASTVGTEPAGWSDMAILFSEVIGGTTYYYQAKWDGAGSSPTCGTFTLGGCNSLWADVDSSYGVTILATCPTSLGFSFGATNTVQVTLPSNYTLVGYMYHNGNLNNPTYGQCSGFIDQGGTGTVVLNVAP